MWPHMTGLASVRPLSQMRTLWEPCRGSSGYFRSDHYGAFNMVSLGGQMSGESVIELLLDDSAPYSDSECQ